MALLYCGDLIRKHDPDRFLISLFAPEDRRAALWALFAFHYEIAKTREVVTETRLGLIRLQWWRDALAGVYEGKDVLEHQVLIPLARAIRAHDLPRDLFENLIYAREFDLEDRLPATLDGMVNYADLTGTPLMQLSLKICGEKATEEEIKNVATVYALTGILRSTPYHLAQHRCYLPEDMLSASGISLKILYDETHIPDLRKTVQAVVERIRGIALPSRGMLSLHAALSRMYLKKIEVSGYDLFSPRVQNLSAIKALRLWWASRRV